MRGADRIPIPLSRRFRWFRRGMMPVLLWFLALTGVFFLYERGAYRVEAVGMVEMNAAFVSSSTDGVLRSLAVDILDSVHEGQVIGLLDDSVLLAEIRTFEREADRLRAELEAEEIRWLTEQEWNTRRSIEEARGFAVDEEEFRVDYLDRLAELETLRIELAWMELALSREEALAESGAGYREVLDERRSLRDGLLKEIEKGEETLEYVKERIAEASERRAGFDYPGTDISAGLEKVLEPIRREITVQESLANEIQAARNLLILRAPVTGMVNQVLRRSGEFVPAGEPIVMISSPHARRIVAHVDPARAHLIAPGQKAEIRRRTSPVQIFDAEVLRTGPGVEQTPLQMWTDANRPTWGFPILIAIAPAVDLLPGELVNVRVNVKN